MLNGVVVVVVVVVVDVVVVAASVVTGIQTAKDGLFDQLHPVRR